MTSLIMKLSSCCLRPLLVLTYLIHFIKSIDPLGHSEHLINNLLQGPLDDRILETIEYEINLGNLSDAIKYSDDLLNAIFSSSVIEKCMQKPQCSNSLFFPNNQMMVTKHVATRLLLNYVKTGNWPSSLPPKLGPREKLEIIIEKKSVRDRFTRLSTSIQEIQSYTTASGTLITHKSSQLPSLTNSLSQYSATNRRDTTLNSDIIGILLFDENLSANRDDDVIVIMFNHLSHIADNQETICVYWDFQKMVWDDDKCIKRNTNEKHSTICLCRRRGHFAILSSNKTTIREDIRNIINIQLPNLIRKINDTIYDEKDVENFMKSILADLSGNFMYSFIKTTADPVELVSKTICATEQIGFLFLEHIKEDEFEDDTNQIRLKIYKDINPGLVVYFKSSSDFGELSVRFPKDINAIDPKRNSIPAVVTIYETIGNVLSTLNPSLPQSATINSDIITVSIISTAPIELKGDNVTITLPHKHILPDGSVSICVSWNVDRNFWDPKGCTLTTGSNSTISLCSCNHLTTFAVLMSFRVTSHLSNDAGLNVISAAGCIISVISLLICIVCFVGIKTLHCTRNTIHINLCTCLLVADLVMIISLFYEAGQNDSDSTVALEGFCVALAILLHYFFLASFMWMGVEGYHVYQSLVRIFSRSVPLRWFYVISYGLPVIIVGGTTLTVFVKHGGIRKGLGISSCWIAAHYPEYTWTFLSFVIAVLLFNVIMAVVALKSVSHLRESLETRKVEKSKVIKFLWQLTVLHSLLGLPWMFGFFQLNDIDETLNIVFTYFSTLIISLQGFFIFLFHCFRNIHVQAAFLNYFSWCKGLCTTGSTFGSIMALNSTSPCA